MDSNSGLVEYEVIYVIVNMGLGSKVLKIASENGIEGATVILGKGTVKNRFLELLDLDEIKKEIVIMIAEKSKSKIVLEILNKKLHLDKPYHGIAFTKPVYTFYGINCCEHKTDDSKDKEDSMYNSIFIIVEQGKHEEVMDAALEMGARGGTIIKARSAGENNQKFFHFIIEPEKEIILILAEKEITPKIVNHIREKFDIDSPGQGIIFVQDVSMAYGIY